MFLVTKSKLEFSSRVPHTTPSKEGSGTRSVSQAGRNRSQLPTSLWQGSGDPKGSLVQGQGGKPHLVRFCRMRGTMLEGGPAFARNGCFSSSAAVARCAGSRTNRRSRKPFRDGDTCGRGRGEGPHSECQLHCPLTTVRALVSSRHLPITWADIYSPGQEGRGARCLELGPGDSFPPYLRGLVRSWQQLGLGGTLFSPGNPSTWKAPLWTWLCCAPSARPA